MIRYVAARMEEHPRWNVSIAKGALELEITG